MSRPIGWHGGYHGFQGHRASRIMRGSVPPFLVLLFVLMILVLEVPPAITGSEPYDCASCHGDFHGENWAGCSACHDSPPATGSHLIHYSTAPQMSLRYGDTDIRSTDQAYIFGCGNCHPLDQGMHRNGTVDVELYNASAPVESLKAKNPSTAAYDPAGKTCASVYCHSGNSVTSGPVGDPLTSPPNPIPPGYSLWEGTTVILDNTGNLTYDPYTVTIARDYKTTPAWGATGTSTTCAECHAFPLTTWYPAVSAMVGDTHQWVDADGLNWGHAYNMLGSGVPCATCHNSSVDHSGGGAYPQVQTTTPPTYWVVENGAYINAYSPAPIKNRSIHVNGRPDVAFDIVNGYRYYNPYWGTNEQYDLTSSTYDAPTKTCGNVSCHLEQTTVKWGTPYRGDYGPSAECNICHRY